MHRIQLVCCTALLLSTAPEGATAQGIRGRTIDAATSESIPSVVVSVLDSAGRVIARGITDRAGFSIPALAEARRLHFRRIGYAPVDVAVRTDTVPFEVTMRRVPTQLPPITRIDEELCERRNDAGQALALWEQARAGLLATIVARETRTGSVTMLLYQYTVAGADEPQVVQRADAGRIERPFRSGRPAHRLASHGYVEEAADGRIFHGPDDVVLFDETFTASHCFSIEGTRGDSLVGIRFTPIRRKQPLPDVEGVLWLRQSPLELSSMEFRYVAIDPQVMRAKAGGSLRFTTMPNGLTVISQWNILAARFVSVPRPPDPSSRAVRISDTPRGVILTRDVGAIIERIEWPGQASWEAPLSGISGAVRADGGDSTGPSSHVSIRPRSRHEPTAQEPSRSRGCCPAVTT